MNKYVPLFRTRNVRTIQVEEAQQYSYYRNSTRVAGDKQLGISETGSISWDTRSVEDRFLSTIYV